ncbi:hypothetical protein [Neobacillus drentensis]|uniref:hypothetical protein n=1 Tax=Neobacillus drentensis TaxID=220684 RepID=UPI002FFDC9E4
MKKPKTKSKTQSITKSNQTYSNRVIRAEFDNNWKTTITSTGYIKYTALEDNSEVKVLLSDSSTRLVVFPKNGYVLVGSGGTSHFSKPHVTITL